MCPTQAGLALEPRIERGWKTYNFEVEEFHTYIAGGLCVHNDSWPQLVDSMGWFEQTFHYAFDGSDAAINAMMGAITDQQNPYYHDYVAQLVAGSATAYDTIRAKIAANWQALQQSGVTGAAGSTTTDDYGVTRMYNAAGQIEEEFIPTVNGQLYANYEYGADGIRTQNLYDTSGRLIGQSVADPSGNTTSTNYAYNPDGSYVAQHLDGSGAVVMTEQYDPQGNLLTANGVSAGGVGWTQNNTSGTPTVTYGNTSINWASVGVQTAAGLGSAIGNALGGNSLTLQIAGSTIVGTMSQDLASELFAGQLATVLPGTSDALGTAFGGALDTALQGSLGQFGVDLSGNFQNAVDGDISGFLMGELAHTLGLSGLGGSLVTAIGTKFTAQFVTNAFNAVTASTPSQFSTALFQGFDTTQFINSMSGAIGGVFGSYLGAALLPATTPAGYTGGEIGSAAGSALGTALLAAIPVIGPLIGAFAGSFIGDIVGTWLGDLTKVDDKASAYVHVQSNGLVATDDVVFDHGDSEMPVDLANATAGEVNQILQTAGNWIQYEGGSGTVHYFQRNGTVQAFDADVQQTQTIFDPSSIPADLLNSEMINVVNNVTFSMLQYANIASNDPIMTAALGSALVRETTEAGIYADLAIAKDYETYLANADAIDSLIEANPLSSFATGWEVTLLEAQQLGLTKIVTASGDYANLSNNDEKIYDAGGNLVSELVFNADGTQTPYYFSKQETTTGYGQTINVDAGETITIFGDGNTINVGDNATVYVFGQGDRVNGGNQDHVTLTGNSGSAYLGANALVQVNGSGNYVSAGVNATVNFLGDGNYTAPGNYSTAIYNGNSNGAAILSNSTVLASGLGEYGTFIDYSSGYISTDADFNWNNATYKGVDLNGLRSYDTGYSYPVQWQDWYTNGVRTEEVVTDPPITDPNTGITTNQQNYTTLTSYFAPDGQTTEQEIDYVDGTTVRNQFDPDGVHAWTSLSTGFDAQDRATWMVEVDHSGLTYENSYINGAINKQTAVDTNKTQWWQSYTDTYTNGVVTGEAGTALDGRTWSSSYTNGALTSWTVFDSANNNPWAQYTDTYGANSVIVGETGVNDDSTIWTQTYSSGVVTSRANYDPYDTQSWSSYTDNYDIYGNHLSEVGANHDGSSWVAYYATNALESWTDTNTDGSSNATGYDVYDVNGPTGWASYTKDYDASGVLVSQTLNNHDFSTTSTTYINAVQATWTYVDPTGASTVVTYDATNTQTWSSYTDVYDAYGDLVSQTGTYDSGETWSATIVNGVDTTYTAYDTAILYPWQSINYSGVRDVALNQWEETVTVNDDQSKSIVWNDVENQNNSWEWATYTDSYDANGDQIGETGTNHDGSTWWETFVGGVMSQKVLNNLDGTQTVTYWDISGQNIWANITVDEMGSSYLDKTTNYYQSIDSFGTMHTYQAWDTTGQASWSSYEDYYDANWNLVEQTGVSYDGTTWQHIGGWEGGAPNPSDDAPAGFLISADFNGDGKSDILWQNDDGTPTIWDMNGPNIIGGAEFGNPGATWRVVGAGYFDGGPDAQILFQNADGTPAIWATDGETRVVGGGVLMNPGPTWHIVAIGDTNGDGKSDIIWQNTDGTPAIWAMDGATVLGSTVLGNPGPTWRIVGAGDFNGDGDADILFQNVDGTPSIWEMNGTNIIGNAILGNPGQDWHVAGVGDVNGDHQADIVWQNTNGTPAIWLMQGTTILASLIFQSPGADWHVVGVGDYTGDGRSDLLFQNSNTGLPDIWMLNGSELISSGSFLPNPGTTWRVA